MVKSIHDEGLDVIKSRSTKRTEFGYGITTARSYLQPIYELGYKPNEDWKAALAKADDTLTYCNDEMGIVDSCASHFEDFLKRKLDDDFKVPANTLMIVENIVTTPKRDRDGDILRTRGAHIDPKALALWQHLHMAPIGKFLKILEHNDKVLKVATALIDINELTHDVAVMIEAEMLRISHGFRIIKFAHMKNDDGEPIGLDVKEFEIMEESFVSVPSNTDAIIEQASRGKLTSGLVKAYAKSLKQVKPIVVPVEIQLSLIEGELGLLDAGVKAPKDGSVVEAGVKEDAQTEAPEKVFINGGTKGLDIEQQHIEPSNLEYDWVSRYLSCEVKEVFNASTMAPQINMGSFLKGLQHVLAKDELKMRDTRRITQDGKEVPPCYELIQLNSKQSEDFLVDGLSFYEGKKNVVLKFERSWQGLFIDIYSKRKDSSYACELIGDAWEWAYENNYLKGEAFSVLGEFIKETDEKWNDIFVDETNEKASKDAVNRLNKYGKSCPNRGMIFLGSPGTGKTLTGRVIRNTVDATFVWVSAKDLGCVGSYYGLTAGFQLARDLAPSVLFIEDVDNWLNGYTIDLMKTEMDGIGQSSGVVTILTTNYPEQLPKALIDRPGRFHDVLKFDLPSEPIRKQMLNKWLPELSEKGVIKTLDRTEGMSGAHIYELCQFADRLLSDDVGVDDAMGKALDKLDEQRETIGNLEAGEYDRRSFEKAYQTMKNLVEDKMVVPYKNTPAADQNRQWDSGTAVKSLRAWAKGSDDELDLTKQSHRDRYKQGFAFVREDGEKLGDYILPHHEVIDGDLLVVFRGMAAVMASLSGARDGVDLSDTDKTAVHGHVARHYKDRFPDSDIPELRSTETDTKDLHNVVEDQVTILKTIRQAIGRVMDMAGVPDGAVSVLRTADGKLEDVIEALAEEADQGSGHDDDDKGQKRGAVLSSKNKDRIKTVLRFIAELSGNGKKATDALDQLLADASPQEQSLAELVGKLFELADRDQKQLIADDLTAQVLQADREKQDEEMRSFENELS